MGKLTITRAGYHQAPPLEQFKDHTIFQTNEWLQFVAYSQNAEPVVAIVEDGNRRVGRFSGLVIRRYGLRILGSPLPGWTTSCMGFSLDSRVSRLDALLALEDFAFRELKCSHVEIMDRHFSTSDLQYARYNYDIKRGFEIDLNKEEDKLFGSMSPACRRCIRKAAKVGVQMEVATDLSFADDYYAQLGDVFAKQHLVPAYSKERVRLLIKYLLPTGQLLLVRAKNDNGNCIATGIFPALNNTMHFWGGASWRSHQELRPNEAIQWFAMRYWKEKGISRYDMGGGGEYKRKYGGYEIAVPWGRKSKYPFLENLRNLGRELFTLKQRIRGTLKSEAG